MQNHKLLTLRAVLKQTRPYSLTFKLKVIKEKKYYHIQQKHCFQGLNERIRLNFGDVHGICHDSRSERRFPKSCVMTFCASATPRRHMLSVLHHFNNVFINTSFHSNLYLRSSVPMTRNQIANKMINIVCGAQ